MGCCSAAAGVVRILVEGGACRVLLVGEWEVLGLLGLACGDSREQLRVHSTRKAGQEGPLVWGAVQQTSSCECGTRGERVGVCGRLSGDAQSCCLHREGWQGVVDVGQPGS